MQIFSLSEGSGENLNPKKKVEHDVPMQRHVSFITIGKKGRSSA